MPPLEIARGALARALALLAALVVVIAGCPRERPPLTVHAAASLSDVLPRAIEGFASASDVRLHFGASSRLAKQIAAGAPGDVFFSADTAWMDFLEQRGLLRAGSRRVLLENRLVVVVPATSAYTPATLTDLARDDVRRLALAGEGVPAGRYARAALTSAGVLDDVAAKVTSADDVRMALAWAARGEADAAVVYETDAKSEPRVKVAFVIPADAHPPIEYPAAVLSSSPSPALAEALVTHLASDSARVAFERAGFRVRAGGAR